MPYFRARHNLRSDYSGYQEASSELRRRLYNACHKYISLTGNVGVGREDFWVRGPSLKHELLMYIGEGEIGEITSNGTYDCVFEAVEIFLNLAKSQARGKYRRIILPDIQRAFSLSGSVYFVNDDGEVNLRVDKKLAAAIKKTEKSLDESKDAFQIFFDAVGNLFGRKDKPKNVVKDVFVAFEKYLKEKTGEKNFSKAASKLQAQKIIVPTQKALLDKIYAYRSNALAVAHAGESKEPDEIDALWFLETVMAQINYIENKMKSGE